MSNISVSSVKELRQRTGLGMMDCKKALDETDGDLDKAEDLLRLKSGNKASKLSNRVAAEGCVLININDNHSKAVILEINCETDFVARDKSFIDFADFTSKEFLKMDESSLELIINKVETENQIESMRKQLVMKLGENISIRRAQLIQTESKFFSYIHNGKIAVLLDASSLDDTIGRDICMHIAAMKPLAVSQDELDSKVVERERDLAAAKAKELGKPAEMIDKIVDGSLRKFFSEVTLLNQKFVKDDKKTIKDILDTGKINKFLVYNLGEGIEKKDENFAEEVQSQIDSIKK
jgi:elongation factor Ts